MHCFLKVLAFYKESETIRGYNYENKKMQHIYSKS